MSLSGLFDTVVVEPLHLLYSALFVALVGATHSPGWALVLFGIAINLILLPVYYQMERAGRADSRWRAAMDEEVARIKRSYRGRERFFYMRTIHRHFGYRPLAVVLSSVDLYLQVLVFATVYSYFSGLEALAGEPFFSIADLSRPDGLLGGLNALPLVMTLANVGSAVLYGGDRARRRNAFILATLFLVLLYRSPSGLLVYWTTNNLFSLVRNALEKRLVPTLPLPWRAAWTRFATQE